MAERSSPVPAPELVIVQGALQAIQAQRTSYMTAMDTITSQHAIYTAAVLDSQRSQAAQAASVALAAQAGRVGRVIATGVDRIDRERHAMTEAYQASFDYGRYQMQLAEVALMDYTAVTGGLGPTWIELASAAVDKATVIGDRYSLRAQRHEWLPRVSSSREPGAVELAQKLRATGLAEVPPDLAQLEADRDALIMGIAEFTQFAYAWEAMLDAGCHQGRMGSAMDIQASPVAQALGDVPDRSRAGGIHLPGPDTRPVKYVIVDGVMVNAAEIQPTPFQRLIAMQSA